LDWQWSAHQLGKQLVFQLEIQKEFQWEFLLVQQWACLLEFQLEQQWACLWGCQLEFQLELLLDLQWWGPHLDVHLRLLD
jgi:hypothetical protein